MVKTKSNKWKNQKLSKTQRKKLNKFKKCNPGILGSQEDIFTLGTCKKYGGNHIPSPNSLIGSPFQPGNVSGWPGVDGIAGDRNYYTLNKYIPDVSRQIIQSSSVSVKNGGGKRRKTRRRRMKRGGGFYQQLINTGRDTMFNIGSTYNTLRGYPAPVNPTPYVQKTILMN